MRKILLAAVALALIVGTIAGIAVLRSDSRKINRKLAYLQGLVSKTQDESDFVSLARAREIALHFTVTPYVRLSGYLPVISHRRELQPVLYQYRSNLDTVSVDVYDKTLEISPDRQAATMELTAKGTARRGGETRTDVQQVQIKWVKQDGEWLVNRVEFVSSIVHPDELL